MEQKSQAGLHPAKQTGDQKRARVKTWRQGNDFGALCFSLRSETGVWGLELTTGTIVRLIPGTGLLGTEIGVVSQGFWLLCEQLLGSGL